jgi:tRNA (cmo5U34)-methyltransferase
VAGVAGGAPRVLDLGAGTGLLAAAVRAAVPGARLTLLDAEPAMLEVAGRRLDGIEVLVADLRDPLPDGPWDAVVSALAIHHLGDDDKRSLLDRVLGALAPGGVFVNVEQVAGPDGWWQARYESWHEATSRAAGTDDAEWAATLERMALDRCAPLDDQLGWLRAAGFTRVDAPVRVHRFAVYAGHRPG